MSNPLLVQQINKELALQLPDAINGETLQQQLSAHINHMIVHRFEALINLLYRIDINENKIKLLLQEAGHQDAGGIIAAAIIERQLEKINTRKKMKNDNNIPEDEKW
ncbi:MAG TPA: hypothetical protein PKC39_06680 [Ferruginibacter sp.]|nr:hypothetical protein [Ferruginibacter sp.]HMP20624.1 hypothetical protein [Ferruginibacter sp.]